MALEDILRKIQEDAKTEAAGILAKAREDEARLLGQGRERAQATVERLDASAAGAAEDARRRELATASVDIRRIVLAAKQEMLESVFEQALAGLAALPDDEYRTLLADLAVRAASTGEETVIVSPRDRERLGDDWLAVVNDRIAQGSRPGKLSFAGETRDLRGGLILRSGDVEINASFERTLASLRDAMEPEIAAALFAPPATRGQAQ